MQFKGKRTSHRRFAAFALGSLALGAGVVAFARRGVAAPPPSPMAAVTTIEGVVVRVPSEPTYDATQIDGRAFPDGVLALTWDDGPDRNTLALAEYLAQEKVSGTFFVVDEWVADLSSDPGIGRGVFETGYEDIPILDDMVKLGHRLGNHTLNHVLLPGADPALVDLEVRANQQKLDRFVTNELRMFRVPGGAWSAGAAKIVAEDPALPGLVGPIRWDVDRKDWENAIECNSDHPARECERTPAGVSRVKAHVTADRYLESIDAAKHGIVLFHDRVGDVGSDYALQIARSLVPRLEARGYVFAAPVLAFSPFRARDGARPPVDGSLFGDLNGDGHPDECHAVAEGFACALGTTAGRARPTIWMRGVSAPRAWLTDVNGDGRSDLCISVGAANDEHVDCGLAP